VQTQGHRGGSRASTLLHAYLKAVHRPAVTLGTGSYGYNQIAIVQASTIAI
jgi:hypothetical protein